jgi:phytoene dehydrogenase-like protein
MEVAVVDQVDAVVVGAGPNGLAGALVLAAAGLQVVVLEAESTLGGGARTMELVAPGYQHDICSAVHPMGLASPFFRAFDLARHDVPMLQPEVAYAQPIVGDRAGVAWADLDRTVAGLGPDGPAWRSLLGPLAADWRGLVDALLSDFRSVPSSPVTAARFGVRTLDQGTPLWNRRWQSDEAPAMFSGVSSHAISPPRGLAPAAAGLLLASLAHAPGIGWPMPRRGSQAIVDAMAAQLRELGGEVRTGHRVGHLDELPPSRAVLLDVSARGLLEIAGGRLPGSYAGWLQRFRFGSAACKVDFALSAPVPWLNEDVRRAGTVHLGGTRADVDRAERDVYAGKHTDEPFCIVVQPGVVDDTRAPAGGETLWSYAHVPHGSPRDMGDAVAARIEKFAPGFRDLVLHRSVIPAAQMSGHDANYVGGDIAAGATTPWQMLMRPVPRWDPFRTPVDGVYLCSSSTPPGPGVHGMPGVWAAKRALRQVFGDRRDPLELVAAGVDATRPAAGTGAAQGPTAA